jgi:hypothetical protein
MPVRVTPGIGAFPIVTCVVFLIVRVPHTRYRRPPPRQEMLLEPIP